MVTTTRKQNIHASAKIRQHCPMNTHGETPHTNQNRERAALTFRGSFRVDIRVEGADVGRGWIRRWWVAGVTGRDDIDLKFRVTRRRLRTAAAREGSAVVRVERVRHRRRLGFPHALRCGEKTRRFEGEGFIGPACAGTQTHSALRTHT